jgi:hypothetical protein
MIILKRQSIIVAIATLLIIACETPVELRLNNPKDPNSPNYVGIRPLIYSVGFTPDRRISVRWGSNEGYSVAFRIERRDYGQSSYILLSTVTDDYSGYYHQYIDDSNPRAGQTYAYRVGAVAPGGAVAYSDDYGFLVPDGSE